MLLLSSEEVRAAEKQAILSGLTEDTMMETAGRGCADFLLSRYPDAKTAVILVGKGKNGGDGYVIARILAQAGKDVTVIRLFSCPSDPLSERMRNRLPEAVRVLTDGADTGTELAVCGAELIVDAVFGIGFSGTLPENVRRLFDRANAACSARVAVDLPSGMYFRADHTLSMLCLKPAHVRKPGNALCGEVHIIPIGFSPEHPVSPTLSYTSEEARAALPDRPFDANKGVFGNTLILGGSYRMPGAPVIAAMGALHAGSGLTTLAFPDVIYPNVTAKLTETLFLPLPTGTDGGVSEDAIPLLEERLPSFSSIVLGPGLGTGKGAGRVTEFLLQNAFCPVVLDADGINLIKENKDILYGRTNLLLTPHPGEMGRLTEKSAAEVNADREHIARAFSAQYGVTLLLKGANTLVSSPDGRLYVNPTGGPALSRGGSGDLLAGVIGALLSQKKSVFEAAALGAYFHGLAGEAAATVYGPYAATIERLAGCLFQDVDDPPQIPSPPLPPTTSH